MQIVYLFIYLLCYLCGKDWFEINYEIIKASFVLHHQMFLTTLKSYNQVVMQPAHGNVALCFISVEESPLLSFCCYCSHIDHNEINGAFWTSRVFFEPFWLSLKTVKCKNTFGGLSFLTEKSGFCLFFVFFNKRCKVALECRDWHLHLPTFLGGPPNPLPPLWDPLLYPRTELRGECPPPHWPRKISTVIHFKRLSLVNPAGWPPRTPRATAPPFSSSTPSHKFG